VYCETVWHFEDKDHLDKGCVLDRAQHLQSCSLSRSPYCLFYNISLPNELHVLETVCCQIHINQSKFIRVRMWV
jgi:hypothetical protein